MDLAEQLQQIAKRYRDAGHAITTEEATKTSLIVPFIQALGYDIYNPLEVIPEFCAELPGTKKGDKVDYVIKKDDEPIILIECKYHGQTLDITQESQLMRYFHALTSNKIAVLTNGVQYRFYTDLDDKNKMDSRPFLQFDITNIVGNENILKELMRFTKTSFDIDNIMPAAEELKYTGSIKKFLMECMTEPSESFVRTLAEQVYGGRLTERMREKFKEITKKAFSQFISERVSDRLNSALQDEKESAKAQQVRDEPEAGEAATDQDSKIVTTQDEIDAYNIIKAILRKHIDIKRIAIRDTVSYCGILLDDSNRKPICRLYFNNPSSMQIGLFDSEKKETRHPVKEVDDIYQLADAIISNVTAMCSRVEKKDSIRTEQQNPENSQGNN